MKKLIILLPVLFFMLVSYGQKIKSIKVTELENIIAASKTPLIVNFFATWCKPCLEELPYFLEEAKKHKTEGLELLLVSLDFKEAYPDAISKFAAKRNIEEKILWLDETDADYFCPKIDKKWSGAIPASLFINNTTGYRKFIEEMLPQKILKNQIDAMLK
jgi:thiol-disulfide isomerase/thioredoxin